MSIRCIAVFSLFYRRDAIAPWSLKGDTRITIIRVVEGVKGGYICKKTICIFVNLSKYLTSTNDYPVTSIDLVNMVISDSIDFILIWYSANIYLYPIYG